MDNKETKPILDDMPASKEIQGEINRLNYHKRYRTVLKSTLFSLLAVAAIAVLIATLWLPVFQIYGTSMSPTLSDGQIAIGVKTHNFNTGDVIAFYMNNKVLIKRVIAGPSEWVNIDSEGNVFVNETQINEPYITEKALGDCNIALPYQVPESRVFVMGDHRAVSLDSRNTAVGCIADEQVVGKIVFCVWPLSSFGFVK